MVKNSFAIFDKAFFSELNRKARTSPRLRQHYNIHDSYADPCQKLFNSLSQQTYIRPHRHLSDPKHELLVAISGHMALVTFYPSGNVAETTHLKPLAHSANVAVASNITPETWHTVLALEPNCVLLEVKAGPFDESAPKDLASWAPQEGTHEATKYLEQLRNKIQRLI